MTANQHRKPPGSPGGTGGQFDFAPNESPSEGVTLEPDWVRTNDMASFRYPPAPQSYEQVVDFWETVEIPDHELDLFVAQYRSATIDKPEYAQQIGSLVRQWEAGNPEPYVSPNPTFDEELAHEVWLANREQYSISAGEFVASRHMPNLPTSITPEQTAPLLRAARMWNHSDVMVKLADDIKDINPDKANEFYEQASYIDNHPVTIGYHETTVEGAAKQWGLSRFSESRSNFDTRQNPEKMVK